MKLRIAAVAVCSFLALAACGDDPGEVDERSSGAAPSTGAETDGTGSSATLLEVGFGQSGRHAIGIAYVENTSEKIGQVAIVQMKFLDDTGALLASESNAEAFSRPGQKMPVVTWVELPEGKKAAKVEATLSVEDEGAFFDKPFPEIEIGPVVIEWPEQGGEGGYARFEITNPTTKPLTNPRAGVVCYDQAKKIIGGGLGYVELVPPSGKATVDPILTTSGSPASCVGYAYPGLS